MKAAQYPEIAARSCAQCSAAQRIITDLEGDVLDMFVKPEIRYVDRPEDEHAKKRLLLKGWRERIFQGRLAVEHMLCVNCLNENALRDKVWDGMREDAQRLEDEQKRSDDQNYYLLLVEDWM